MNVNGDNTVFCLFFSLPFSFIFCESYRKYALLYLFFHGVNYPNLRVGNAYIVVKQRFISSKCTLTSKPWL